MTIRLTTAAKRIGRHHSTLRRWIKEGRMPKPRQLNPGKGHSPVVFDLAEFESFVREATERGMIG